MTYRRTTRGGKRPKSKPRKKTKPSISLGETVIASILDKNLVRYTREKTFPWLLGTRLGKMRLDFYLPDIKTAIEFDGIYHSRPRQAANDAKKDKLLYEHDIRLIRIHYRSLSKIENILKNHLVI